MLTKQMLEGLPPGQIFATGEIVDSPLGINMMNTGKQLRWVATRGVIPDWAIYCHWTNEPPEWIRDQGQKVGTEVDVKRLMPCDDDALAAYRY